MSTVYAQAVDLRPTTLEALKASGQCSELLDRP
jgi:hypothetical protein